MEGKIRRHFNEIIENARAVLEDMEIEQDYSVKSLKEHENDFFSSSRRGTLQGISSGPCSLLSGL